MQNPESRRVRFFARLWVGYYYAKFVSCIIAAIGVLLYASIPLLAAFIADHGELAIWVWVGLTCIQVIGELLSQVKFVPHQSMIPSTHELVATFGGLRETVTELCRLRRIKEPEWYVQGFYTPGITPEGVMLHPFVGNKVMILNAVILSYLTPPEQRAVIAHELRHQDASTNTIGLLFQSLVRILSYVWKLGMALYVASKLLQYARGKTPDTLLEIAFAAMCSVLVYVVASAAAKYSYAAATRADEMKTDLLSVLDTNNPTAHVHALDAIEGFVTHAHRRLHAEAEITFGKVTEESEAPEVAKPAAEQPPPPGLLFRFLTLPLDVLFFVIWILLWSVMHITGVIVWAMMIWARVTISHPSNKARRRSVERIYGPIADPAPRDFRGSLELIELD